MTPTALAMLEVVCRLPVSRKQGGLNSTTGASPKRRTRPKSNTLETCPHQSEVLKMLEKQHVALLSSYCPTLPPRYASSLPRPTCFCKVAAWWCVDEWLVWVCPKSLLRLICCRCVRIGVGAHSSPKVAPSPSMMSVNHRTLSTSFRPDASLVATTEVSIQILSWAGGEHTKRRCWPLVYIPRLIVRV